MVCPVPEIRLKALDGSSFSAYASVSAKSHAPGLLVIHGVAGLDEQTRLFCDRLSALGYNVLCPFLFDSWTPVPLMPVEEACPEKAAFSRMYKGFDLGAALRMLFAGLAHLRKDSKNEVGAVGFCLGGALAFLLASRSDVDIAIGYDCSGIESFLDELLDIRVSTLFHFGGKDDFVSEETRQKIVKKLSTNSLISTHVYPDAGHAFLMPSSEGYHAASASLAEERTKALLLDKLKT